MEISIQKSWRKSLSMRFDNEGVLQVRAPKFMLQFQIDAFLEKNKGWIEKHYKKIEERKKEQGKYYLFGKEIKIENTDRKKVESFYKKEAHAYIKTRCEELAKKYGFTFSSIKINSANTRWGSCTSKKNINFSYRLIMTPKDCIDYVIIHELCHLREMNHGPRFWKQVSQIMPDYQEKEKHLKEFGWRYKL